MTCGRCQRENPADAAFCDECGARLDAACPSCGEANRAGAKFCRKCGHGLTRPAETSPASPSKFASPDTYTPKHLAEKILTSKAALEGERKQVTVLFADLKGSMELLADRDPEEARKLLDPVLDADDGGRPPLRGHRQPGDGRRHHGALRRAARPRGSRRARVLCRAPDAGRRAALLGRAAPRAGRGGADPRRPQLRRGRGALDRQRSPHGLHRRGPDHAPGGAHGAARGARQHPAHRRDAAPGRGLRPGHPARPGADQGARRAGRGVRAGGGRRRPHPPRGRGAAGAHALRRPRPRSWSSSATPSTGPAWGTARWSPSSGSRAWASRGSSGSSPTPTACTAGSSCSPPRSPTARPPPTCP